MDKSAGKVGGNESKKGPGRPRRDIDPENTEPLFVDGDCVNPVIADSYRDSEIDVIASGARGAGAVGGVGDLFSLEARMAACAALAESAESESVRLQAIIKYSELERQLRAERGGVDIAVELAAVLDLIKADRPGDVAGTV